MTDHKTISAYDSQVDTYMEVINESPSDNQLLDFIGKLKPNDYVLDLGCGPAVSSMTMRDHGLRVDPVDGSLEMVNLANKNFDIGARQAMFEDIDSKACYDGIWANFSLLHATREELPTILESLHRALQPKGILYLGMKVGHGSARDKYNRYYSYYSHDELSGYLTKAGFVVDHVEFGEAMGMAGNIEPWIALTSFS